jgi:hypothetical protein
MKVNRSVLAVLVAGSTTAHAFVMQPRVAKTSNSQLASGAYLHCKMRCLSSSDDFPFFLIICFHTHTHICNTVPDFSDFMDGIGMKPLGGAKLHYGMAVLPTTGTGEPNVSRAAPPQEQAPSGTVTASLVRTHSEEPTVAFMVGAPASKIMGATLNYGTAVVKPELVQSLEQAASSKTGAPVEAYSGTITQDMVRVYEEESPVASMVGAPALKYFGAKLNYGTAVVPSE